MKLTLKRVAEYGAPGWRVEVVQINNGDKVAKVWTIEHMDCRELANFGRAIGDIVKAMES